VTTQLLVALYKTDTNDDEIYAYVKPPWMEIKLNVYVEPWVDNKRIRE
jgi:hypothetical protein